MSQDHPQLGLSWDPFENISSHTIIYNNTVSLDSRWATGGSMRFTVSVSHVHAQSLHVIFHLKFRTGSNQQSHNVNTWWSLTPLHHLPRSTGMFSMQNNADSSWNGSRFLWLDDLLSNLMLRKSPTFTHISHQFDPFWQLLRFPCSTNCKLPGLCRPSCQRSVCWGQAFQRFRG